MEAKKQMVLGVVELAGSCMSNRGPCTARPSKRTVEIPIARNEPFCWGTDVTEILRYEWTKSSLNSVSVILAFLKNLGETISGRRRYRISQVGISSHTYGIEILLVSSEMSRYYANVASN